MDRAIDKTIEIMLASPFDAIAFTGTSGAAIAYPLSFMLGIPLICVRKNSDNTHHGMNNTNPSLRLLEGNIEAKSYLIVDDFSETGQTITYIIDTIRQFNPESECVGFFYYLSCGSTDSFDEYFNLPVWRIKNLDLGPRRGEIF